MCCLDRSRGRPKSRLSRDCGSRDGPQFSPGAGGAGELDGDPIGGSVLRASWPTAEESPRRVTDAHRATGVRMGAESGWEVPPGWYRESDASPTPRFWTGERWSNSWRLADGSTTKITPEGAVESPKNPPPVARTKSATGARSSPQTVVSSRTYLVRLSQQHAEALVRCTLKDVSFGAAYHLQATTAGLEFRGVVDHVGSTTVGWGDIIAMEVQDASRFTATRLVTLGLAGGLALKKQFAILGLGSRARGSLAIKFDGVSASELSVEVQAWQIHVRGAHREPAASNGAGPSPLPSPTVRERLQELAGLHEDGLVTAAEYESRRQRILEDL